MGKLDVSIDVIYLIKFFGFGFLNLSLKLFFYIWNCSERINKIKKVIRELYIYESFKNYKIFYIY